MNSINCKRGLKLWISLIYRQGWYLPVVPCCTRAEKKMAAAKRSKRAESSKESFQVILSEANEFVKQMKKPKKKSRYLIFRDPTTGKRESQCPYKPRFQQPERENFDVPSTSDASAVSSSAIEGRFNFIVKMSTYIKLSLS